MENSNLEVTPNASQNKSFAFRGIIEVFYKPVEFFKELKDNPKVLVPYVVMMLLAFTTFYLLRDLIFEMQLDAMRKAGQETTPEMLYFMKAGIVVFPTIIMAIYPLLVASIALFFGNFVFAGKASFKEILSVSLYGAIVFFSGGIILVPMMLAKESMAVSFSFAVLVADMGIESVPYVALSKISIFQVWEIIVVGIGLGIIYDVPRNKGYMIAVLSVGMLSIIHIALTALGAMFS